MTTLPPVDSAKYGHPMVLNYRAPQGNVGGITSSVGTLINPGSESRTGTATGTAIETGTGTGGLPSIGSVTSIGTTASRTETSRTATTTSDPISNTQITTHTTSTTPVPSTAKARSSQKTTTQTTSTTSMTTPPFSFIESQPTSTTLFSTFVSTLSNGKVQTFTTPIPTALVSSSPNSSPTSRATTIIAATVSAFAFMLLVILAALFMWRRNGLKLRTMQQEREKGKEGRRLLEDEDFAVDDEDRWSWFAQSRNITISSIGSVPPSLRPISPVSPLTDPLPSENSGQPLLADRTSLHARNISTSTTSTTSSSTHRPSSSKSTLLPPPSLPGTPRGYTSQDRSSLQLTPVQSSSSWISRPVLASLPPYKDPFGVGPPLLPPPVTKSSILPKTPTTNSPFAPHPKSFVASPQSYQSPGEWLRSPKSATFAQAAADAVTTTPMTAVDTTATDTVATAPQQQHIFRKKSTADSMHSISDSVSEYSQESMPLHVLFASKSNAPSSPPPVPPIPLVPFRPS